MITPLAAAKAYAAAQTGRVRSGRGRRRRQSGANFADMLKGVMNDTVATSKAAETRWPPASRARPS